MPKIPKDARRKVPVGRAVRVSEEKQNPPEIKLEQDGPTATLQNPYYDRISKKLRNMKYLLILLMVIMLVLTLWAYRDRLTYDNFRYLLRDMDEAGNTAVSTDTVYYTANDTNNYLYFRGDLAVASSYGVEFHRSLGNRSFEDKVSFRSPSICGSEKYMIAYDVGGKSFYVYNSISRVYSENLNSEIVSCAAADNGNFAVLCKRDVGGYEIHIYNKDFKRIGKLTRDENVYLLNFLPDGRLTLCECLSDGVSIFTDFSIYTPGSDKIERTVQSDGLVLMSGAIKDGFYLLSDTSLSFYSNDGKVKNSYSFGTSDLLFADADGENVTVLLEENKTGAECGVYTYTESKKIFSASVPRGAKGIALCNDISVVLYSEEVVAVTSGETQKIDVPSGTKKIIGRDSDNVIICYDDYAKIFKVR